MLEVFNSALKSSLLITFQAQCFTLLQRHYKPLLSLFRPFLLLLLCSITHRRIFAKVWPIENQMRNDEGCGWGADKKLPSFLSQAPIKRIHDDLQFQNFQLRRWKINYIRIFMIALLSGSGGGDLQETQLPLCAFGYGHQESGAECLVRCSSTNCIKRNRCRKGFQELTRPFNRVNF